jgi:hypothetical protein
MASMDCSGVLDAGSGHAEAQSLYYRQVAFREFDVEAFDG